MACQLGSLCLGGKKKSIELFPFLFAGGFYFTINRQQHAMFSIFRISGFAPYVVMLFLNAFVDLGHKIVIQNAVFKYYSGTTQIMLTALVNALVILPFIMLFSPSGFLADKYPKQKVLQLSAAAAIVITVLITVCYYAGWFYAAFALTFVLGLQAALYSPAKYGYIKELAGKGNLAAGNAVVQAVTITAILLGVFVFSIFFEKLLMPGFSTLGQIIISVAPVGFVLIVCTAAETALAFRLPQKRNTDQDLRFDYIRYLSAGYLKHNLSSVRHSRTIWRCIVGLAVFWGVNQVVLAVFGAFLKEAAGVTNTVIAQGLLAVGGIGIIAGSLTAGKISKKSIATRLVPVGAAGMSAALFILPSLSNTVAIGILFLCYGLFGGLFIVPLNALIQLHADEGDMGRVLAANNFIQNIVMTVFLGLTILVAMGGLGSVPLLYLMCAVVVAGALYTAVKLPKP